VRRGKPKQSIFHVSVGKRDREEVDLTPFLTEAEESKQEVDMGIQADAFAPRPPTPPYRPAKRGVDAETQVEPEDGLFVFDVEVEPLLDVLCRKTTEQAVMELSEEAELVGLQEAKLGLLAGKREEAREVRAMELKAVAHVGAQRKEMKDALRRKRRAQQCMRKVVAMRMGRAAAGSVWSDAWDCVRGASGFVDPTGAAVEQDFLPMLYKDVSAEVERRRVAVDVTNDVITAALEFGRATADAAASARRKAARRVRVFLEGKDEGGQPVRLGPVVVPRSASVKEVETAIQSWLKDNPVPEGVSLNLPSGGALHLSSAGQAVAGDASILAAAGEAGQLTLS
jgi:hypothetical protein